MHHDWLLKQISYNDLDLLASVRVQGRYNLCLYTQNVIVDIHIMVN